MKGVVVATPHGRGVVLAKAVVDSTGSAAIAAAAGAQCIYIGGEHIAVQGTGLPYWEPGARYTNTDYAFIDDLDVVDAWQSFLAGRKKFADRYDLGQLIDSRERRQIVGDFFLSPMDVYLDRTFPDSVVRANSNFDSHGFTIHPMFMLRPPDRKALPCYVPYRCLLPKGIEGVLVTGLGVSAHRDVMPVIRMQPDVQNQGYAAGVAAATAARTGKGLREIDIRELQRHLVEKGNLPEEVLTHEDSFPLPKERVEQAVRTVAKDFEGIEVIFAQTETALPLLREAYKAAASRPGQADLRPYPGHHGRSDRRRDAGRGCRRPRVGQRLEVHRHGPVRHEHEPAGQPDHRPGPNPAGDGPGADPGQGPPIGPGARTVPPSGRRHGPGDAGRPGRRKAAGRAAAASPA